MSRRLAVAGVVAIAVAVAAYVWISHSFDGIVARTIEAVGSELLGSHVSVEHVRVALREGRAKLSGLAVSNPAGPQLGFSSEPALILPEIAVELELAALDLPAIRAGEAPLSIALVRIARTRVNAEVTEGGLNLERLRQNARDAVPSRAAQPLGDAGAPIRIRIARLEFAGGELRADASRVGGGVEQVAIPEFVLEDLGGVEGASAGAIGKRVSDALLGRAIRAAALGGIDGEVGRLREKAQDKLRGLFD